MNRLLAAAVITVVLAPAVSTGEPLTKAERDKVVQYLSTTRDQVISEVSKRLTRRGTSSRTGPLVGRRSVET